MRPFLIAAAALAASGFIASTAVAQSISPFDAGGPKQVGSMCRVNTSTSPDMDINGYYAPCGEQARAEAPRRHHRRY